MFREVLFIIAVGVLFGVGANLVKAITDITREILHQRYMLKLIKKLSVFNLTTKDVIAACEKIDPKAKQKKK